MKSRRASQITTAINFIKLFGQHRALRFDLHQLIVDRRALIAVLLLGALVALQMAYLPGYLDHTRGGQLDLLKTCDASLVQASSGSLADSKSPKSSGTIIPSPARCSK